jgi:hypothetical protein
MTHSRNKPVRDTQPTKTYEIGYKKPPQHSRWTKGQSGNPRGRPRKGRERKTFEELLLNVLNDGFRYKLTSDLERKTNLEVLVEKLFRDALSGKKAALDYVIKTMQKAVVPETETVDYAEQVRAKLEDMARRSEAERAYLASAKAGANGNEPSSA